MNLLGRKVKTVIQPPGWNPFQTFLMSAAVISGIFNLFSKGNNSQLLVRNLPLWIVYTWYAGITIGGTLALIGMHINFRQRLLVKIIGLSMLGSISSGYCVLVAIASGRPFSYPMLITAAFAAACIIRTTQLLKILRNPHKSQEVIVQ